jgi:DNA-binding PadR family transcriptional regulator
VASGLIEETKEFYDGKPKYSYKLTSTGREWLEAEADKVDPSLRECSALFKKNHWRTLELAASALFLERAGDADRTDAISKALSLKPDCKPYKDNALTLIEQLRL